MPLQGECVCVFVCVPVCARGVCTSWLFHCCTRMAGVAAFCDAPTDSNVCCLVSSCVLPR